MKFYENNVAAIAAAVGVTRQAVEQWGPTIPERAAYRLNAATNGVLQVVHVDYEKRKRGQPVG